MKENELITIITKNIGNAYIGDDCAYLKDLGIVVSQDNLVEDIHFNAEWYTSFQLGYKSVIVNISDILASGGIPAFVTIGLSLPSKYNNKFVDEFYKGAQKALNGAAIIGGDITGSSEKLFISITAIGMDSGRKISSRKNAKTGYVVITRGNHGTSSAGLCELINKGSNREFINAHLMPNLEIAFSEYISKNINSDYAMMDTSDGLADALFKIAEASNKKIVVDYSKISHLPNISKQNVLFGGEDYKLVAAVPKEFALKMPNIDIIGQVEEFDGTRLKIDNDEYFNYNDMNTYNHFGD